MKSLFYSAKSDAPKIFFCGNLFQETTFINLKHFKVGLSPSKKACVICLIESPLKMMKNIFYFILKVLFVLKIFKFLSSLFGHLGKTA